MGILYLILIFAGMYVVCVELEKACADSAHRLKIPESTKASAHTIMNFRCSFAASRT